MEKDEFTINEHKQSEDRLHRIINGVPQTIEVINLSKSKDLEKLVEEIGRKRNENKSSN